MRNLPQIENAFNRVEEFTIGVWKALAGLFRDSASSPSVAPRQSPVTVNVEKGAATVLAVDDDETYLNVIGETLRQDGMRVFASTSPSKGLDMLRYKGGEIDVVLLDYNMPILNGEVTLRHMRKICPDIKVIALTGVEAQELPASFREEVDDFL